MSKEIAQPWSSGVDGESTNAGSPSNESGSGRRWRVGWWCECGWVRRYGVVVAGACWVAALVLLWWGGWFSPGVWRLAGADRAAQQSSAAAAFAGVDREHGPRQLDAQWNGVAVVAVPIREVRLGQRVAGQNPEGRSESSTPAVVPDAATWRVARLRMLRADGAVVELELLRPLRWFEAQGVRVPERSTRDRTVAVSARVWLDLEEMGVVGPAELYEVGPCPPIDPGPGAVVTGRFRITIRPTGTGQIKFTKTFSATSDHAFRIAEQQLQEWLSVPRNQRRLFNQVRRAFEYLRTNHAKGKVWADRAGELRFLLIDLRRMFGL